jgi:DNA-directed RNA polymerase specialized sigma24 family protein
MSEPDNPGSITRHIALIKQGDPDAAQLIWQRYFQRLVGLARARLRGAARRAVDEEDVALSAFDSLFRRAGQGQFPQLEDRDDLWQILFVLTVRKAANLAKAQSRAKRGGGAVLVLSDLEGRDVEELLGSEPTPALVAQVTDECRRLYEILGAPTLQHVARRKLEGFTNAEIAAELGCVEATVERKLQRIRNLWSRASEG